MSITLPYIILPSAGYALSGNTRINFDVIQAKLNDFNSGTATWDSVYIGTASSTTGTLRLFNSSSTHYTGIQAGNASADVTYTLPTAAPASATSVLQSTTGGTLSWTDTPTLTSLGLSATSNQIILASASTHPLTITVPAQSATCTWTIPNKGTTSVTFACLEATQTFTAIQTTFQSIILAASTASTVPYLDSNKILQSSTVTPTELGYLSGVTSAIQAQLGLKAPLASPTFTGTVDASGLFKGKGTATNDNAAAGYIGEFVSSEVTGSTNTGTSNQFFDATSFTLSAGDWMVSGAIMWIANGATIAADAQTTIGISSTSGNDSTGLVQPTTRQADLFIPSGFTQINQVLGPRRVSISTSTTYYLKALIVYSLGQPQYRAVFYAWRMR